MDPVGFTSRLTAAARARETERPDRLFNDEFAATLAGPEGFDFLDSHWVALGGTPRPTFAVRARFFDDFLLAAARNHAQTRMRASPRITNHQRRMRTGRPGRP
jgi:O-methyltransferase involved in polyketide biosynthesis